MSWIFSGPACDEPALHAAAQQRLAGRGPSFLSREELRALAQREGVDAATATAYAAFLSDPAHAAFLAALDAESAPDAAPAPPPHVVIVPTMYYRERPEIGGDGALWSAIARRLHGTTALIETASLGSIERNADTLIAALSDLPAPLIVVSLSKGSADLKRALIRAPQLWAKLSVWISCSGMIGGTPLASDGGLIHQTLLRGWLALRGAEGAMLTEMRPDHPFSQASLIPPAHCAVVNLVGLPLGCHLRQPVCRSHAALAAQGPNDGCVLLADALLPGAVCPVWGADHYLRTPEVPQRIEQLLRRSARRVQAAP